ncbi:mechanosensitive ion channel family protein [Motilimonas eburnea]|nr:mechanosensitive ion channel family protein [Motilimonas eburnea]
MVVEHNKLITTADEERLYFEDVLSRQNKQVRDKVTLLVNTYGDDHETELGPVLMEQVKYLETAIKTTKAEINRLLDAAEQAADAKKIELSNYAYENMITLDQHYFALADTFTLCEKMNLDVSSSVSKFKRALVSRADMLSNMLRFYHKRENDLQDRMLVTTDEEKAELTKTARQLAEVSKLLVANLENTVLLLDRYKLDTAEYKQLIFSITGEITVDVLNFNVVSGLATQWLTSFKEWALVETPTLIMRLLLFVAIIIGTRSVSKLVKRAVKKSVSRPSMKLSKLMQEFFIGLSGKITFVLGLLIAISQLGINLGPLLAGFGVAGIVIGLALQDTLSNFASGMMILIYRPFDVGDFVDVAGGVRGKVSHMSLVSTTIKTFDHQRLIIPNNKIWGDTINNISAENYRRVDMLFGIGYGDDIRKAEQVLQDILETHPLVLKDKDHEYVIKVHALGESSVDFAVRPWVENADYWTVYWDVTRAVKLRFDEEGISIPFPQRDVHIYQHG